MKYKRLGRTGLKVSEICLGCMTFGEQADEAESRRIVDAAWDVGVNFFDTADVYTDQRSEVFTGNALKSHRHDAIIATKVFGKVGPDVNDQGLSRKHIFDAIDNSLQRLGTDYIDLYQVHRWDPETPIEETMDALDDLVRSGKVRYIGCSNFAAWQLMKSLWVSDVKGLARFDSIQPRYNILYRDIEEEILPLCRSEGVGVNVYNPLAAGLLSGKHTKGQAPEPNTRFALRAMYRDRYWHDEHFDAVERLRGVAAKYERPMVHLALGWVLAQPNITTAIVGASNAAQLRESLGVIKDPLSAEILEACTQAVSRMPA